MRKVEWEIVNLTKIGNSYGLILNRKILNHLGITETKKIRITFADQSIVLKNAEKTVPVNLDRSTWGKQFDQAFKTTGKPEKSIWPDSISSDADNDWTW